MHPLAHSMQRGATLFESIDCMASEQGVPIIFRLHDHMLRFENSARIVGMALPYPIEVLEAAVRETVTRGGLLNCTIRPLAYYADPVFDIYPGKQPVTVLIGLAEKKPHADAYRVQISRLRKIDELSMPVKAKVSGNYIAPMIAKSEALAAGFDDTVMLDRDGFVAECATANIFMVEEGHIFTAPGDRILQGITRNTVMQIAASRGIELLQKPFTPERMKSAAEVFMSSSGLGVMPVVMVDDAPIGDGRPGPVTRLLHDAFLDVATGRDPRFEHWLTYIR